MEDERVEYRREDVVRRNIQLGEIRQIGRDLVVQSFKCKKKRFVLNAGFDRKPEREGSELCCQTWQNDR